MRRAGVGVLLALAVLTAWLAATLAVLPAAAVLNVQWDRGFTMALVAWSTYGLSASGLVFLRPRSAGFHLVAIGAVACACATMLGVVLAVSE